MIIMIILLLCPFAFLRLSCFRIRHTHTCMDQAFSFLLFFLISFNFRVSSDLLFLFI